jgi:pro-sigmaK processing inhibitor BofA
MNGRIGNMVEVAVSFGSAILGILLIVGAVLILRFLKNVLVNAVLGVIALIAINLGSQAANLGLTIPLTAVTVVISAVLGLAGVGILILLKVLGVSIQ